MLLARVVSRALTSPCIVLQPARLRAMPRLGWPSSMTIAARSRPATSKRLLSVAPPRATPTPSATASATASASTSAPAIASIGIFKYAWRRYTVLLETRPIATKVVTAFGIAAIGDIGCQLLIEHADRLEHKRVAIFGFLNGVVIAPMLHGWYNFMNKRLPGTAALTLAKRIALDQLGFIPVIMPLFFGLLLLFEGRPEALPAKLQNELWPTLQINWMVWVPAQLVNFGWVPIHLQVLFANMVSLGWNSYLSYVTHGKDDQSQEQDQGQGQDQDQAPGEVKAISGD